MSKTIPEPETDENDLINLASETLRGDMRDSIMAWFKAQPKAWGMMSEKEQRDLAWSIDSFSSQIVKTACQIIAAGERPALVATLVEYREKDGVEAKIKLPGKGESILELHKACGREVLIVTSGAEDFMGEGGEPEIDADQPILAGIGEEYADL